MTVLEHKTVTTRKEHECFGCCEKFPKGSKMEYNVTVDQGDFGSYYLCLDCVEKLKEIENWVFEDGFSAGEIKQYYDDYIREQ